jgi:diguanylate cyclase (GGDEF)-like protein/PAS domain S-box-containing protein
MDDTDRRRINPIQFAFKVFSAKAEAPASDGPAYVAATPVAPVRPANSEFGNERFVDTEAPGGSREQDYEYAATLVKAAFDQTQVGLVQVGLDGNFLRANRKFCDLLGFTQDQLTQRPWMDLLHPDDSPGDFDAFLARTALAAGGHVDRRMLRKDGAVIWTRQTAALIRDDGQQAQFVICTINDISEDRANDAANRKANAFMRSVLANSPLAVYTTNAKGVVTSWNRAAERMYGFASQETIGRLLPFVPESRRPEMIERIARIMAGESQLNAEMEHLRRDGSVVFVNASLAPLYDGNNAAIGAVGMCVDVSEAKRAEAALHASEARFRWMTEGAQDVIAIVSPEGLLSYASPSVRNVLGVAPDELLGQPINHSVHPEDASILRDLIADVVENASGGDAVEFRYQHKNGAWRWLEALATNGLAESSIAGIVLNLRDVTDRRAAQERVTHLAYHDNLTGLPNRSLLQDRIGLAITRARRKGSRLAVVFIDLDNFKNVNDTMGHDAGDLLLKQAAQRLQTCVRAQDTIARQGGDEFIVLVEELVETNDAVIVAQKIQYQFKDPIRLPAGEAHVSSSIGIAVYPDDGDDAATLLRNADTAMYHSKSGGKNSFSFFTAQMNTAVKRRTALESALRRGVAAGEIEVDYQPQVWLSTRTPIAVEALVRWRRDGAEVVSPHEFLPVAEETGLMTELGDIVLREALASASRWREAGTAVETLCINVSTRELMDRSFAERVIDALADARVPSDFLELEINESQLMRRLDWILPTLTRLRDFGVHLCIDDFGSGYSSLSALQRLPVEKLKISASFIRDMSFDMNNEAIVSAIINMAKSLGMDAVAKGVETEAQANKLLSLGCQVAQGFLFSRPVAAQSLDLPSVDATRFHADFVSVPTSAPAIGT